MKASEMTNEELAAILETQEGRDGAAFGRANGARFYDEVCREAAARLRKPCTKNYKCDSLEERLAAAMTVRTDNSKVIAELQRRLKVAEDALDGLLGFLNDVRKSAWWMEARFNEIMVANRVMTNAEDALAEIRGEGGAK